MTRAVSTLTALIVLVLLVAGAGCSRRTTARPPSNDRLVIGYDREPDTMNRFSTHILEDIQSCIIEGLTTTDEQMRIVPLLATEVPTPENGGVHLRDEGGMDVTWKLRPGVKWHDGVPFTSADVRFTVEAINDPSYNPESTDGFDRISSVDTPDPLTAVVHYREVYAPYALQFVRGFFPRHVLQGKDIDRAQEYNRNPLGTGPYRLVEWKTGEHILLERVPDYWQGQGRPRIRQLLFKFIANTNTRIAQLRSGEVHVVALVPWDKVREIDGLPGLVIHRMMGNSYEHVTLNQRQFTPFADLRVRQAMMHATDRELIAKTLLDGLAPVVHGAIQPLSWAFTDDVRKYVYDRPQAEQLLDQAGWLRPSPGAVRQHNGQPLAFTLLTQSGFAVRENVSQALQRQWREVGIDTRIQLHDGTTISALWFQGRFDAMLHWWHMPADPELTLFFASDRTPPHGRNINYLNDDAVTKVLYASDRTVNRAERTRLLHEAQRRLAELAPEIPLYNVTRLDAVPASLRNFKGNPTNAGIFWNVHKWGDPVTRFVARRLMHAVVVLLIVSGVAFTLLQALPGGPVEAYLSNPNVRPQDIERLRRALGLDRPAWQQYASWMGGLVRGDFGYSYSDGRPVLERIVERLPATLELVGASLVLGAAGALVIGLWGAIRRGGVADRVGGVVSVAGISLPVFWFGLVLQLVFAVQLGWLPSSGRGGLEADGAGERLAHLVLPTLVLAFVHAAAWSRYLRSSLIEALAQPFVRTAASRGLAGPRLVIGHALRAALVPVLTVVLLDAALMVSGAVVTESVFAWPGVGSLFTEALSRRDYTVLMAFLMLSSTAVVALNLLADVIARLLDPRIGEPQTRT